ncbi:MAG: stage II sporulation protein M [Myxococcales bacterium]|nr:stage II sporulation protein M [Myxococcales bacterium]MCB9713162.1 stage II sporulation protein M [Myxococcales bacterium]
MSEPRDSGWRTDPDAFVARGRARWEELEGILSAERALHRLPPERITRAGRLYRTLCADLAFARGAGFPHEVLGHLDALASRAHGAIYRAEPYRLGAIWDLVARDFPRTARESWRFLAAATALFVVPAVVVLVAALADPELATQVLPREQLQLMTEAYSQGFEGGRSEATDTAMTGFYVSNNVGVAFRCFATGIFGGLGSAFFLVLNGLYLGAVLGWVHHAGAATNLLTFVAGHGAFELTAIVIAGAAGLRMGYALVRTDGYTRLGSLRHHGPAVARLVLGAALMLGIAALVEGFWSPSGVPNPVKWGVAAGLWLLVLVYLARAGRGPAPRRPEEAPA